MNKTSISDYIVIASANNRRLVKAISNHLLKVLKELGVSPRIEGINQCDWVLIDTGDIIVHVFEEKVRKFYNIEKIWAVYSATSTKEMKAIKDG